MLGLLTNAVQTLAGVLLPSATVFLLLLCNDKAVLGPWVNGPWLNLFTGAVIWILVMLSMILTVATVFTGIDGETILLILGGGTTLGIVGYGLLTWAGLRVTGGRVPNVPAVMPRGLRASWRMPPLETLAASRISTSQRVWMGILRVYLVAAVALVLVKVVQIAVGQ